MATTIPGVGKGKLGGSGFYKNFRLAVPEKGATETVARYRVLPPLKSCAENGKWAHRVAQHFGYKGHSRQDPTKLQMRPFACIQRKKFGSDIIEVSCEACNARAEVEAKIEKIKEDAKKDGLTELQVEDLTQVHRAWLKEHNVDAKYHIFVMDEQGDFGDLQITPKCKTELDNRIKELQAMEVDPWDLDQGVWFEFHRSGTSFNALTDTVTIYKAKEKNPNGPGFIETLKLAPITVEQIKHAMEILPELTDVVRVLSGEQIKVIVDSKGDPTVVDAVFGQSDKSQSSKPAQTLPGASEAAAKLAQNLAASNPQDEIAALQAKLAALQAQQTQNTATAPAETKAPAPSPADVVASTTGSFAKVSKELFDKTFLKKPTDTTVQG